MRTGKQFLYIMKCNEFYKIGITNNLKNRMRWINTSNPYETQLLHSFVVRPDKIEFIESQVHGLLDKFRVKGEWFKLDDRALSVLVKFGNKLQAVSENGISNETN